MRDLLQEAYDELARNNAEVIVVIVTEEDRLRFNRECMESRMESRRIQAQSAESASRSYITW